ncbi:hypothetical protein TWF506_008915 [Arthrobotrys conoides]|uniref:Uncharacterized protein n=1 Tax=Arthrobotrys conoides TaxID=74498 RepID=A0AAN8NH49_9PEZI
MELGYVIHAAGLRFVLTWSAQVPQRYFNFAKISMDCDAADGLARDTARWYGVIHTRSHSGYSLGGVKALKRGVQKSQYRRFICNSESTVAFSAGRPDGVCMQES